MKSTLEMVMHLLTTKKFWVELIIMTVGMFVAALGVYFFLIPSKLIVGSITGLSLVLAKLLPFISVGTIIFVINAVLLVLSFLLIGNEFGAKTVYTALILGPMIDFLGSLFPMEESIFAVHVAGQVIANPWFDLLCFVIILSASQSILFSINASTGGLDILAKIINKYTSINLGTAVSVAGWLICCTAFAINDVNLVVIGLIGTWLNGMILSHFMTSLSQKTRVVITTQHYEKIRDFVVEELKRGITLTEMVGGYSHEKGMRLEIILTRDEFSKLLNFLNKEDLHPFISIDTVSEVYGIWNKKTKKFL
nr:YitT family protein [Prevotella dentasini]